MAEILIRFTLHAVRVTYESANTIHDAKHSLSRLKQELEGFELVLTRIHNSYEPIGENLPLAPPLTACQEELKRLQEMLQSISLRDQQEGCLGSRKQRTKKDEDIKKATIAVLSHKLNILMALQLPRGSYPAGIQHDIAQASTRTQSRIPSGRRPAETSFQRTFASSFPPSRFWQNNFREIDQIDPSQLQNPNKIFSEEIENTVMVFLQECKGIPGVGVDQFRSLDIAALESPWAKEYSFVRKLLDYIHEQRRNELLRSIPVSRFTRRVDNPETGTCEWLLQHPRYISWMNDPQSSVLYLSGKAGSGKSVLAKYIVNNFEGTLTGRSIHILHCFCSSADGPEQAASSILGDIVYQCLRKRPAELPLPAIAYLQNGSSMGLSSEQPRSWPLGVLWELFLELVRSSGSSTVYCIIDALDECTNDSISEFLQLIREKMTSSQFVNAADLRLKFFLTSREYPHIEECLGDYATRIRLNHDMTRSDIEKVVERGMATLRRRFRLKGNIQQEIKNSLVERSEGMFLWVLFSIKQLERTRGTSVSVLKSTIVKLPRDLNGVYRRMLETIERGVSGPKSPEKFILVQKLLRWVVLAQRPLTVTELALALGIKLDSVSADLVEQLLNISWLNGTFLEITQAEASDSSALREDSSYNPSGTVRIIHQSARTFFLDDQLQLEPPLSKFRVDWESGHAELASICLAYLDFTEFRDGPLSSEASGGGEYETALQRLLDERFENFPFLDYAVRYWPFHAKRGMENITDETLISQHPLVCLVGAFLANSPKKAEAWYQLSVFTRYNKRTYFVRNLSALHIASMLDLYQVVLYLLDSGVCSVHTRDGEGRDALSRSLSGVGLEDGDCVKIARALLDYGADINAADEKGWSVLLWAAWEGKSEVIRLLLDQGVNREARNNERETALHLATSNGHEAAAKLLLDNGADKDAKDNGGWTTLHHAARNGHGPIVKLLLDNSVDRDTKDHDGRTALSHAAQKNHEATVKLLLDNSVDKDAKDNTGKTALHYAARSGHEAAVKLLLDSGVDRDAKDNQGRTALHHAARKGHEATVRLLLDNSVDRDVKGNGGKESVVWRVTDRRASGLHSTNNGKTPLHSDATEEHEAAAQLLTVRGANTSHMSPHRSPGISLALLSRSLQM